MPGAVLAIKPHKNLEDVPEPESWHQFVPGWSQLQFMHHWDSKVSKPGNYKTYLWARNNVSRIREFLIPTAVSWKSSVPMSRCSTLWTSRLTMLRDPRVHLFLSRAHKGREGSGDVKVFLEVFFNSLSLRGHILQIWHRSWLHLPLLPLFLCLPCHQTDVHCFPCNASKMEPLIISVTQNISSK